MPAPRAGEDLSYLLGGISPHTPNPPNEDQDDAGKHKSLDGLQNVRVFGGSQHDAQSMTSRHDTAKYFFQRIIEAADTTNGTAFKRIYKVPPPTDDPTNNNLCSVRYDQGNTPAGYYPRLVAVHYAEDIATGMAWIEYEIDKKPGEPAKYRHSHRMIFVERSSFNSVDYYNYATSPKTSYPYSYDGLPCSGVRAAPRFVPARPRPNSLLGSRLTSPR